MSKGVFQVIFVFVSILCINIGYYLYQLVLGKYMGVSDFGMISSLFALQMILVLPGSIIGLLIMRYIPLYSGDISKKRLFLRYLMKRLFLFLIVCALGVTILTPLWVKMGVFHTFGEVLLLIFIVIVSILLIIIRNVLFAERDMILYALNNIGEIVVRIVLSIILISYGFSYEYVYGTYLISVILALLHLIPYIYPYLKSDGRMDVSELDIRSIQADLLPMIALTLALTLYGNIELVLAKHFLTGDDIGHFSGALLIGKIVLAGLGLFGLVGNPYFAQSGKHKQIITLLYGVFGISAAIAINIYAYYPELLIRVLFSEKYLPISGLLRDMAIIMTIIALATFLWNHGVIAGKGYFGYLSLLPVICIGGGVIILHPTTTAEMVHTLLLLYTVGFGMVLCIIAFVEGKQYLSSVKKL